MADKPDPTDDIYDEGAFEDDGTADVIRNILDQMEEPEEDAGGLDQPLDTSTPAITSSETVSEDEGRDLISDSELGLKKPEKKDEPAAKAEKDDKADAPEAKADDPAAETKDESDDTPDIATTAIDKLIEGLPDDRRAEVSKRLDGAARILAPFENHKAELERHGQTPEAALNRLLELNTFAQTKPDEYLAWVAKEVGDPKAALEGAAKLLGLTVTEAKAEGEDDDDDPFADEATLALKRENAELKAKLEGKDATEFGPDTPARQQMRDNAAALNNLISEKGEDGQPKRPRFHVLQPQIQEMARQHVASTQKPVTVDDLSRFYEQAHENVYGAPPGNSAAQTGESVQDQIKKQADATAKAKRASKSVDGKGQGASRRPSTLSPDVPLDKAIGEIWDNLSSG